MPGYDQVLGHEFVGVVEACASAPGLVGARIVGEINCNDGVFDCADAVRARKGLATGAKVVEVATRQRTRARKV